MTNLDSFLKTIAPLEYQQMAHTTDHEWCRAQCAASKHYAGSDRPEVRYAFQMKALAYYLRTGKKHVSISTDDFQRFKIIAEKLVADGIFKREYLEKFVVN
jgi:aspartyl-tRNA synthetase